MVGLERTVLPLIATQEFGLASRSAVLSFLASFGAAKALTNLAAGRLADLADRKRLLVAGWLFGLPVPFMIIGASSWTWIVAANVLLGINQGLCWSMTVVMKPSDVSSTQAWFRSMITRSLWRHRTLSSCSQAGLVNNLNDGMAWGLFPLFYAASGLNVEKIGLLAGTYPAVWGLSQLGTGALSDRWRRKWMIVWGMWVQALGIWMIVLTPVLAPRNIRFESWLAGAILLGSGTGLVYPTLLAAVADTAAPSWRAVIRRRRGYIRGFLGHRDNRRADYANVGFHNANAPAKNDMFYVFDPATDTIVHQAQLPNQDLHLFAEAPGRGELWMTARLANQVVVIETQSGRYRVIAEISMPDKPDGIAFAPDGSRAFVAHRGTAITGDIHLLTERQQGFSVIDVTGRRVLGHIPLDGDVHGLAVRRK